jgi:hypothetical protein
MIAGCAVLAKPFTRLELVSRLRDCFDSAPTA